MTQYATEVCEHGDTLWPQWSESLERLRAECGEWIGASPEEIALVPNTTFGINMVAEGLRWQAGENIVIPGGEFPSNVLPWQNQQRKGVELRVVPSPGGRIDLDGIRRAIDRRTKVVAASWVGFASGYRVPLADLCQLVHERGAMLFVDAIQGLGVFPLDVAKIPIDFLAADGHKWMLGPEGAGLAFVRRSLLEELDCASIGWNSVVESHLFQSQPRAMKDSAMRFEGGSANMAGLLGLRASLSLFRETVSAEGVDSIAQRIVDLHGYARGKLRSLGVQLKSDWPRDNRSGILSLMPRHETPQVAKRRLAEAGIVVSCRGGALRASFHAYNTTDEIDHMIDVLRSNRGD